METDPARFIVEPWNAVSSLLMLIPALYWIYRIRNNPGNVRLLWLVIFLVAVGGIGSALFHGFRASLFFLLMDVLPSAILTLTLCVYFWIRVLRKWWHLFFILIPDIILISELIRDFFDPFEFSVFGDLHKCNHRSHQSTPQGVTSVLLICEVFIFFSTDFFPYGSPRTIDSDRVAPTPPSDSDDSSGFKDHRASS